MAPPEIAVTPRADDAPRVAARSLLGAIIGGLLIAAIEFAALRDSLSLAATEQLAYLMRLAVHWTLAAIPLGISFGLLEHRARGRTPIAGGYVISVLTGACAGALALAVHGQLVDPTIAENAVGFQVEFQDRILYGLRQLLFWGTVFAVLHASSLRQRRVASLLHIREVERLGSERALAELRLAALQAQIEPEFLLSSLTEVERLYPLDPTAADRVLDALIRFLREATPLLRRHISTLGAESRLLRAYMIALRAPTGDGEALQLEIDQTAAAMPVPSGVLLSLAQALFGAAPAEGVKGSLDVRAKARSSGSGVDLSITAVTAATPADLQTAVARVERRLAVTSGRSPSIELRQDGARRLTLSIELHEQGEPGNEQVAEN